MEIKLFDNSRITFERLESGGLSVQLWRPGFLRDGHGYLLSGGAILDGAALDSFLAAIAPPPPETRDVA